MPPAFVVPFRRLAAAFGLILTGCTAAAAQPAVMPTGAPADGTELTRLFDQLCLRRFPDQADLSAGQGSNLGSSMTALTPEQVRAYLHDDPGRGWIIRGAGTPIAVTIEDPPFRACAVRRFYGAVPDVTPGFQQLIRSWAAQQGRGPFLPPQTADVPRGTMRIHATTQTLPAQGQRPGEVLMAFTTQYTDGQVELRLVRQIPRPDLLGK